MPRQTTKPAGQPVHVGDEVTDYLSGRTYTVRPAEGDTTCPTCGGLVRNWTRYTLTNPRRRRGAEVYAEAPDSCHVLSNGLSGPCPGQGGR